VINGGKISLTNLGTITPMNFEGYLIFSLAKEWVDKFHGIPKFSVKITKNGRLHITSEYSVKKGGNKD